MFVYTDDGDVIKKLTKMIPLSAPSISGNEWDYLKDCLDTGWVSSAGKYVDLFEEKLSKFTNSRHAIACVNGTSALHASLRTVGVRADDEVIVPSLTFIAPVNTIRYLNAKPVFMDCDDYYCIDSEKTIEFIEQETKFNDGFTFNKVTGKRISAIIPVHTFGNGADLEPIINKCRNRNIKVVEDASESLGTVYQNGKFEGCHTGTIGDIGCLSFNGNKIITTGQGGMIITNNTDYAEYARYITTQAKDDKIRYIHNDVGYNYRISNIQAALGVAQLEQLRKYLSIKKQNYDYYKSLIDNIPGLHLADLPSVSDNNCWLYTLQIDQAKFGISIDKMIEILGDEGIEARPIWHLNHLQKPYQNCQTYKIDNSTKLAKKSLNLPSSIDLTYEDIKFIISKIKKCST